jgi:Fe-S cluster biogenesis protein NfuA
MEEEKIREIIDKLRPFLISDGGNIEFVKYEDNIVYVKMLGACAGCDLIDMTLKEGVESAVREEVPSVKGVVNVTNL